ncbi:MAG: S8 family serine peptidase [Gammaproteobacteria bacterium]|nr:S8 family serine peptidase [Gammaproteobacteria bacterium]
MGEATFTISGDKKLFQDVLGKKLRKEKTKLGPDLETEFFTSAEDGAVLSAPGDLSRIIEGIALTRPPEFFAGPSPIPPLAPIHQNAYRYLFVPDEVAVLLRATRTHRTGGTGMGIKVAMCDTGFYRHPFYSEHGYRVLATQLAAGAVNSATDDVGHGTGEAANIFALAPDVQLIPIKMGDPIDAIKKARNSGAKVITNSWGYSVDVGAITWATLDPYLKALAQEIQLAINAGVTVCFAAGNGHYAFPASMPSVVAVGGVHVNYPGLDFEASSYASSFASKIFPGRAVPDVCGLTGKKVNINGGKAPSLMLPVQPSCQLDGIDPSTGANSEGWGLFSGTSAACPQVAGVCALMLEKNAGLTPAQVKTNLMKSARDVKAGQTAMGTPAGAGPDLATGAGLVDAKWAYLISMGSMAARFLEATREEKALLLQSGQVPDLPADFVDDLIETLRSR